MGFWKKIGEAFKSQKPITDSVYISVILDKPLQGISLTEPAVKPWVKVNGIGLTTAAQTLPGKTIDWHTVPMELRAKLELGDQCAEMDADQFARNLK